MVASTAEQLCSDFMIEAVDALTLEVFQVRCRLSCRQYAQV